MVHSTGHNRTATGFSLIEVQIAIGLLLVGLLGLASATTVGMSTMAVNRENANAVRAALRVLETLETGDIPFESLFTALCADPVSNPTQPLRRFLEPILEPVTEITEPITQPLLSRYFNVDGLEPRKGDADGTVGELILPVATVGGVLELREDVAQRDLNGDGLIDTKNHAADYTLLPVTVRVEWAGRSGTRRIEMQTLLTRK
jgi:type II secretory pathway pseudopilin PulG